MPTVKPLPEFTSWLAGVNDQSVRGAVVARIKRLQHGLAGDVAAVGEGISELRIHLGAGWRIYFVQRETTIVILLCGGSKRTQAADIRRAKTPAARIE
jgi:putative addiction module killer protein